MEIISIIVPVYNAEKTLPECIKSVLEQCFDDFELLLIDNNSKDNSEKICREFERSDKRIKYFLCEEQGVSSARNFGVERANGKYLFFLDSDDLLDCGFLEKSYACIKEFKADLLIPSIVRFSTEKPENIETDSSVEFVEKAKIPLSFAQKIDEYRYFQVFKLYRTEIIKKNNVQFEHTCSLGEDLLFNLDYLGHCSGCVFLESAVYYYRYSNSIDQSLSRKYRTDMLSSKNWVCGAIHRYLTEHNLFDEYKEKYFAFCSNEIYTCIANAFKPQHPDKREEFSAVLNDRYFRELLQYRFKTPLQLKKRLFLKLAAIGNFTLTSLVMRLVRLLKLA